MLTGFFDLLQQDLFYLAECGKTKRNQMKIQLFIEFIYSVIYCIQLFLTMSTQSTQSSVYTCCAGSQILYPGRLGWDERCERMILSVFATISMINHYWSSDVVRLQRGRDSFLFVDVCFFYQCCHSYMHSWVSALMVTRLWYRHRWRSQQWMQWSQTYFKSKLCCMSPVNLK